MRIAFVSNRPGVFDLYVKPSNGSGAEARLVNSPNTKASQDWSRDGRWLVYHEVNPTTGRDLWALGGVSDQRVGPFEVVVQPFPDAGGKWQVSTAGGVAPRWRADGKELYFLASDATMMAVPVTAAGASFEAGSPKALFPTRIVDGGTIARNRPQYAVARDGRFLINQPVADATATPITLILNWNADAKK